MIKNLTKEELNKIYEAEDMLKGNINRMCVTDDLIEFARMYYFAKKRIDTIFEINFERIKGEPQTCENSINKEVLRRKLQEHQSLWQL